MPTSSRERCHVCGAIAGARRPRPDVEPTCPRNECQLAAAGIIGVDDARRRLLRRKLARR